MAAKKKPATKKPAKRKPKPSDLGTGAASRSARANSPAARKKREEKYGL